MDIIDIKVDLRDIDIIFRALSELKVRNKKNSTLYDEIQHLQDRLDIQALAFEHPED